MSDETVRPATSVDAYQRALDRLDAANDALRDSNVVDERVTAFVAATANFVRIAQVHRAGGRSGQCAAVPSRWVAFLNGQIEVAERVPKDGFLRQVYDALRDDAGIVMLRDIRDFVAAHTTEPP